jgi:mono/diheme cytochrome c family protein
MKRLVSVVILLGAALCAQAADAPKWAGSPVKDHARINPLAGHPDAVAAGNLLYRDHCAQCHRDDALGDQKVHPSLRTDRVRKATDGDLEWFLRQGDLRRGMPSWSSLPQAQRWQIIVYLRSLSAGK